ncbi:hypothetical protein HPB48_021243 [Haemaphysalis longicornis]|uniref:Uncharacterized protein n=1 Tax=Haemaphysalis longicornis TaxID=44386 RepID=A0A9J6GYN8_HAELO|nr:hypothetical protein HPB48_021243 [Haemaphysalis longicornis]
MGNKASEKERERAIGDGVSCLQRTVSDRTGAVPPLRKITACLKEAKLNLLQADKTSAFVVLPEGLFNEKSLAAVHKNFKQVNFNPKKQKLAAVKFLKEVHLDSLGKAAEKAELGVLEIFFKAKTAQSRMPPTGHRN